MRLLTLASSGEPRLGKDYLEDIPAYAILSHTWGPDEDEVTFENLVTGRSTDQSKAGYTKIRFCGEQAKKDGLQYFWVDTCCIDRANHTELSEAIASMFRWYRGAAKCYVYLSDVSVVDEDCQQTGMAWQLALKESRWFRRGWTLQELIAPKTVDFFSRDMVFLGSKATLEQQIKDIVNILVDALRGAPLHLFTVEDRMSWTEKRETRAAGRQSIRPHGNIRRLHTSHLRRRRQCLRPTAKRDSQGFQK